MFQCIISCNIERSKNQIKSNRVRDPWRVVLNVRALPQLTEFDRIVSVRAMHNQRRCLIENPIARVVCSSEILPRRIRTPIANGILQMPNECAFEHSSGNIIEITPTCAGIARPLEHRVKRIVQTEIFERTIRHRCCEFAVLWIKREHAERRAAIEPNALIVAPDVSNCNAAVAVCDAVVQHAA